MVLTRQLHSSNNTRRLGLEQNKVVCIIQSVANIEISVEIFF